ncbi:T9SS type A sorting domain-containing protein [Saprospira sp. CCB-QB6]|uniref:T9SS type A sorting domain-containing protein n=1 Tax=Saprospira sp. CCB-QB6 TaxID=3023936 RepID=UPI00234B233A|nr:T9SS type A sorting domain-containing protein [Saprospira sp. CCB-QB6]WCL80398.1 T9SS type A sorting domain-containing protein [Saprospira sp. CCB-QB6]
MTLNNYKKWLLGSSFLLLTASSWAQHNNELYNDGALIKVQAGAEVYVMGDVHQFGATALMDHDGYLEVQGDMYSDNLFQQRGTGTTKLINDDVNAGQTQFISGSYAVRGGQAATGVDDGSFYDLQLANDQGVVWLNGTGNIADVRNSVDFNGPGAATVNRIITADPSALPTNGAAYPAVFGVMNPTAGLTNMLDNTVNTNGNMSAIDNGYVQGKLRRAIDAAGGTYGYVLGLEPAAAGAQRGMQYIHLDFSGANNYDVITGHFQTGLDNSFASQLECSGYQIDYWGGLDHGQWVFDDFTGSGTGDYAVMVWPQDDNFPTKTVWLVTKDNAVAGTADDCGGSPVSLERTGFNGFSQFGVAAADILLAQNKLLDLEATPIENNYIQLDWSTEEEDELAHFEVERSLDNSQFSFLEQVYAQGNSQLIQDYQLDDYEVLPNVNYYYRLRLVNNDGTFSYSPTVVARLYSESEQESIRIFPNPASGNTQIDVLSTKERDLQIRVFDAIGKLVYEQDAQTQIGHRLIQLPAQDWPAGLYLIQIAGPDFQQTKELIKTH